MPVRDSGLDIARNVRTIEWLKAEILAGVSMVFQAMLRNKTDLILDGLANTVISCFLLARRLGVGFTGLENRVRDKVRVHIDEDHDLEKWYGDFTSLSRYFDSDKGWKSP